MADFITIIPQSTFNDTQKLLKEVNAIADAVERVNKEAKKIKFPSEARGVIEKTNEEIKKTNKLLSDTETIRKRQQTAIKNLTVARSKENKTIQEQRVEAVQLNKQSRQEAILTNKLIGAYQKLNLRRSQASQRLRDLIASENASNREIRRAQREFDKLDKRIRKANGAVKSGTLDVGRYKIALGSARINALRFASALGFTGILFGIARGFQEAIRTIREFDAQLIAVGKTTGLQGDALDELAQKTVDLGLRLKGISITGLLQTAEVAGQLGIKGTENILSFSQAIETLKSTSDVASEESVRAFAQFIGISKDTAKNADRLASVITILGNNLRTTESAIIEVGIETQKGLQLFNVSAESALGLAGALAQMGVKSAAARTSLLKTFRTIQQSIFTGKNLDTVLKLTNLTQEELSDQFNKDATGVFLKFLKGLQNIEKTGGNVDAILGELKLSGDRVSPTISTMAVNFDKVAKSVNMANQEYIDNTAASEELQAATKSLNSIIGDAKDAWDAFILSIDKGDGVISKFIRTSAQNLTTFLEGLVAINTTAVQKGVNAAEKIVNAFRNANEASNQETINFIQSQISAAGNNIAALQTRLAGINKGLFSTSADARREKQTREAIKKEVALREQLQQILIKEQEAKNKVNKEDEKGNEINEETARTILGTTKATKDLRKAIKQLQGAGRQIVSGEEIKLIEDAEAAMNEYMSRLEKTQQRTRDLKNATDDFLKTFSEGFFADAGLQSLTTFFDGTFDLLLAGADNLQEKFAVTFAAITEVAQEAFRFIEQAQANSIQKQLDDLTTQKEIALALNEGNADAIAAINEQAAAKEAEIRQKQAEQNKQNALFNIAINTAQGIVAALASFPPNIPLSIAIGIIGALQAAIVASTPIPAFKDGVEGFKGGLAVVGDGGVPEVIRTPDNGTFITPSKPTLVNLPKDTDVHKNVREFDMNLNRVLMQNRIEPLKQAVGSGITATDMDKIFSKNMRKMTALNINMDQNGFSLSVQKGLAKTNIHRNRVSFKGKKV